MSKKKYNLNTIYISERLQENLKPISQSAFTAVTAPMGYGKTTAINCMLSLLKYDKGSIHIFGEEMRPDNYKVKQQIGIVLQNVAVFDELTVYENIDYFCGLYVPDKRKRKELVEEAITFTDLNDYRKMRPKKLSGGLLRRLNIACGIAHKPRLIIMDEPTVAVDPQSRNKILKGIQKLNEQGSTIIYTSHYMEEVEQICTRIAIMDHGHVIASGTKEELKKMIKTGETITIEAIPLTEKNLEEIRMLAEAGIALCRQEDGPYLYEEALSQDLKTVELLLKADSFEAQQEVFSHLSYARLSGKKMPEASENKKELVKNYRNQIKDGLNEIKEQYFGVPFETAAKYLQEAGGPVGVLIDLTLRFSEAFAEKKREK